MDVEEKLDKFRRAQEDKLQKLAIGRGAVERLNWDVLDALRKSCDQEYWAKFPLVESLDAQNAAIFSQPRSDESRASDPRIGPCTIHAQINAGPSAQDGYTEMDGFDCSAAHKGESPLACLHEETEITRRVNHGFEFDASALSRASHCTPVSAPSHPRAHESVPLHAIDRVIEGTAHSPGNSSACYSSSESPSTRAGCSFFSEFPPDGGRSPRVAQVHKGCDGASRASACTNNTLNSQRATKNVSHRRGNSGAHTLRDMPCDISSIPPVSPVLPAEQSRYKALHHQVGSLRFSIMSERRRSIPSLKEAFAANSSAKVQTRDASPRIPLGRHFPSTRSLAPSTSASSLTSAHGATLKLSASASSLKSAQHNSGSWRRLPTSLGAAPCARRLPLHSKPPSHPASLPSSTRSSPPYSKRLAPVHETPVPCSAQNPRQHWCTEDTDASAASASGDRTPHIAATARHRKVLASSSSFTSCFCTISPRSRHVDPPTSRGSSDMNVDSSAWIRALNDGDNNTLLSRRVITSMNIASPHQCPGHNLPRDSSHGDRSRLFEDPDSDDCAHCHLLHEERSRLFQHADSDDCAHRHLPDKERSGLFQNADSDDFVHHHLPDKERSGLFQHADSDDFVRHHPLDKEHSRLFQRADSDDFVHHHPPDKERSWLFQHADSDDFLHHQPPDKERSWLFQHENSDDFVHHHPPGMELGGLFQHTESDDLVRHHPPDKELGGLFHQENSDDFVHHHHDARGCPSPCRLAESGSRLRGKMPAHVGPTLSTVQPTPSVRESVSPEIRRVHARSLSAKSALSGQASESDPVDVDEFLFRMLLVVQKLQEQKQVTEVQLWDDLSFFVGRLRELITDHEVVFCDFDFL